MSIRDGWPAGFQVLHELGSGGHGEVVAARDLDTGVTVALKRGAGSSPDHAEVLRREAAMLSTFRHPHVVGLRSVEFSADQPVLVLDYAAGGSLGAVLAAHGPLSLGQVARLVAEIGAALTAAHAVGLVHGDVTPGNILVDAAGQTLLADLGTARLLGQSRDRSYATTGFADPSVKNTSATVASDVYGLAAVAAFAMTGTDIDTAGGVRAWAELAQQKAMPSALVQALCAGLTTDPSARSSMVELITAVGAAVGDASEPIPQVNAEVTLSSVRHTRVVTPRPVEPEPPAGAVATCCRRVRGWFGRLVRWPQWLTTSRHKTAPDMATGAVARRRVSRDENQPRLVARLTFGGRLRPTVGKAALVVGVSAVAVLAGVGWASRNTSESPARAISEVEATKSATPASLSDWTAIIRDLDAIRGAAFEAADPTMLRRVYQSDSAVLRADEGQIQQLASDESTAHNVRHDLAVVAVLAESESDAGPVILSVRDTFRSYQIRDGDGAVVREVPAGSERMLRVTVVRQSAKWLISDIQPG